MKVKRGDKVEITWLDAAFENSNMSIDDAKSLKLMLRSNVGYLVDDDGETLRLSFGEVSDQDKKCTVLSDILVIPRGDVKSVKKLK